jgi:hypothetical protein
MTTTPLRYSVSSAEARVALIRCPLIASALAIEATRIAVRHRSGKEPLPLAVHDAAACQVVR